MGKAIWLGHARDSNETIVGTTEGAVKTYAIKRMPEDERWDAEFIRNIRGIPQQPDPKRKGATIPISFKFESISTEGETHPSKEIPEPMARRRGITQIELEKYGFTPGCPGCLAKQRGEIAKRGHSEACRKRIEDMMRQDGEDRKKIEAADERITRQVARRIEQEEKKKRSGDVTDQDQEEEMHEDAAVHEMPEKERSDQMHENPVNPDVTMEEEKSQEEDTTLGEMIFKLSQYDPTVNRWIEGINSSRRKGTLKVSPAPVSGAGAALSSPGTIHSVQADVSEVYSPPRVTTVAAKTGLNPGSAMDLRTGYDFSKKEDQERARQQIRKEKPKLLVGSPECKMFSALQRLSAWTVEKAKRLVEAKAHMKFVCELYQEQIQEGRWILHEHPVGATSWKMDVMMRILKMKGVSTVVGDQCQFGLKTENDKGTSMPARKRTRFMSNSVEILKELGKMCPGNHIHQHLISGRAEKAAVYPEGLCRAICRGLIKQIELERGHVKHLMNISGNDSVQDVPEDEESQNQWHEAWDDVSGKELDPAGVQAARSLEIKHVDMKKVWRKIPRAEAKKRGCKMIGTRWVDIDNGGREDPGLSMSISRQGI